MIEESTIGLRTAKGVIVRLMKRLQPEEIAEVLIEVEREAIQGGKAIKRLGENLSRKEGSAIL